LEVVVEDVEYQQVGGRPLLARIYRPNGAGPFPSVVDVHGGAWHNGDRLNDANLNQAMAARGVLVAAIDFRQPPEAGYPASVQDLNLAIRWLKANAPRYNGKARVGAFGPSSGGHVVALAGIRPNDPRYSALPGPSSTDASLSFVIPCWPVIDPLYRFRHFQAKGNRQEVLQAHLDYFGSEGTMTEAAPETALEKDPNPSLPPMLMMLKEDDDTHPFPMQEAFMTAYSRRGGSIEMVMFKTAASGPGLHPDEPEWGRVTRTITDFAHKHG
jgi:acetyl esterase/lipase